MPSAGPRTRRGGGGTPGPSDDRSPRLRRRHGRTLRGPLENVGALVGRRGRTGGKGGRDRRDRKGGRGRRGRKGGTGRSGKHQATRPAAPAHPARPARVE